MKLTRRRFLKAAGWGVAAGLVGLGGELIYIQPRRHHLPLPDGNSDRSVNLSAPRRVVVVGGGVAGLVAGIELQRRHFAVTLLEGAPALGGKLGGWLVRAGDETFPVEHGFHGFFTQYYNLNQVMAAAGIGDGDFGDSPGYPVLFGDRPPEGFGHTTPLFPFNLLSVIHQSRNLHLRDFRHPGEALLELMRYEKDRTFGLFDRQDFAAFARNGAMNQPMIETVLKPFGKTTLNRLDHLSAAEAIRFFHFYFMGNPEGLQFRYLKRDSMTAVVNPLKRHFESLGGQVRTGTWARRLVREGGRVARVVVDAQPDPAGESQRFDPAAVPAAGFLALPVSDGSSLLVARRGDGFVAFDGHCTHMGCPVAPDALTGGLRCPCHGGRFDADGRPTGGPPERPLVQLAVLHDEGGWRVAAGARPAGEESVACDHCVVACEVRGVQKLLGRSDFLGETGLRRGVSSLGESDPYVIWRLWLDRPTLPTRAPFYTTSKLRYTDAVAVYSRFQEPYTSWATRSGGSVVEVHAYAIAPEQMAPPAVIQQAMFAELMGMMPELAGARVLHDEFQLQSNFTRWAPGDRALRPATETALPNLVLAGDWVALPAPAALMEAAAMSGRLAANAILRQERLREIEIPTVAPRGPLA